MVEDAGFQRDYVAFAKTLQHSHSYAPSVKRVPFHSEHSENRKRQKEKYSLFPCGRKVWFHHCEVWVSWVHRRSYNYLERQSGGDGISEALVSESTCCAASDPFPLLILSCPTILGWSRKCCFTEIYLLPSFPLLDYELSLPLNLLIYVTHNSLQSAKCLSIYGFLTSKDMARFVEKMSKNLYPV